MKRKNSKLPQNLYFSVMGRRGSASWRILGVAFALSAFGLTKGLSSSSSSSSAFSFGLDKSRVRWLVLALSARFKTPCGVISVGSSYAVEGGIGLGVASNLMRSAMRNIICLIRFQIVTKHLLGVNFRACGLTAKGSKLFSSTSSSSFGRFG